MKYRQTNRKETAIHLWVPEEEQEAEEGSEAAPPASGLAPAWACVPRLWPGEAPSETPRQQLIAMF